MKRTLTIVLLSLQALAAVAFAQKKETPLTDALKGWKTVRIAFVVAKGGDFAPPTQFILLQRLNSEHVVLSSSDGTSNRRCLPVFRAILTNDEAQKIMERAKVFYGRAQMEIGEIARLHALPEAERLKANSGRISASCIRIEVSSRGEVFTYQDDFDNNGPTVNDFIRFVNHPQSATE